MSESISIIRSYQDGVCPDCGLEIPLEAVAGQACQNCGHVFVPPHPSDDEETSMLDEAKSLIKAIKGSMWPRKATLAMRNTMPH
jgi:rubredoxin